MHLKNLYLFKAVDCDQCVSSFSKLGGCSCMENPTCDVTSLISKGCYSCGYKATEYCFPEKRDREIEGK